MKTTTLVLILLITAPGLWAQTPPPAPAFPPLPARAPMVPPASAAAPEKEVAGYSFTYQGVDVNQVLDQYAKLVNRTLLRGNVPQASIVLVTQSPLTKTEAIEALQAVLALNNITVINIGEKFVKVLPPDQAGGAGAELNSVPANQLPDLGSYVTHIVQLKFIKPSAMVPIITPFARLQGSITPLDDNGILVIRDYAENVKRMLEMIDKIDVNVPAVYISEVIPIRYAQADDIASALNSLGGSGSGGTVSVGSSSASTTISGLAGNRAGGAGMGGLGGTTQSGANGNTSASPFGQQRTGVGATANPNGTPSSTTPFQQRLLNLIGRPSGGGGGGQEQPIQVFGQAKIIADERSNSLLIFATREDMAQIKHVISQLDVLLAQVLIEAVIIDYSLGHTFDFSVSAAQNSKSFTGGSATNLSNIIGTGAMNNSSSFTRLLNGLSGTTTNASSGLSYYGNIGPTWDVALTAAAADSHASIIQRPRIQTSQAIPAQFFVGSSVPYITGNYSYYGGGPQNSYSQLSVGVELDVTPFINPDGLVVMQIQQEIDEVDNENYNGTGQPSTIKRSLNSEIAVRDKDTVMLGGFIKNKKSTSRSGVPLLQDIPLLGALFSSRSDSKSRDELIVLMRPTVLKTPEIAAANTLVEERRLPNVSRTMAEEVEEQNKAVEAERKLERSHPKTMSGGAFNTPMPTNAPVEQVSPPATIPTPQEQLPQPQARSDGFFTPAVPNAPAAQPGNSDNATPP